MFGRWNVVSARGDEIVAQFVHQRDVYAALLMKLNKSAFLWLVPSKTSFSEIADTIEDISELPLNIQRWLAAHRADWMLIEEHRDRISDHAAYVMLSHDHQETAEFIEKLRAEFGDHMIDALRAVVHKKQLH